MGGRGVIQCEVEVLLSGCERCFICEEEVGGTGREVYYLGTGRERC